ncbi:MAG: hypothetical protein JO054_01085, partial [Actinobacteria bacterium]|nr:hypothetical protein [Actinomycetota bacterium]
MVIETLTGRLADGVDEEAFLEADRRFQTEFVPNHTGFVRRTTARGAADDEWLVLTFWYSAEDADKSARLAKVDAVASSFLDMLEDRQLQRFETLD